ncbi:MAG: dihydrolipoamide acetyltransferase family protein [Phycisphaerales bacterium]
MPIEMKMPRLSDTMEQGTVVKWNVKPGQKVRSGDVVADIETDKATMELQTFDDGTVATLAVPEGQTVKVGTVIMVLAGAGEDVASVQAAKPADAAAATGSRPESKSESAAAAGSAPASHAKGSTAVAEPPSTNGRHAAPSGRDADRVFASPLAKKIAGESGIDLRGVEGSGPGGRIVRKDVEAALSGASAPSRSQAAASSRPSPLPAPSATLTARNVTLSNMRRTIAKRLVDSKTTIPHYQVTVNARMDALMTLRAQLNEQLASQGVKLSVNDFLVRACALAMHQHPYINSRWVEKPGADAAVEFIGDVNIGVAIALPVADDGTGGGLVVATVRAADQIGLRQISAQSRALSDKARGKGLSLDEMSDSTFTISNLGMFGVEHFTAIINPPNTAILAVGAAVEKPVVHTDPGTGAKSLGIGHEMSMTMSSDHRVIDGAMAAKYLATVKELLEKPATLLV